MRVTLDTNVLVSAFISKRGYSADILDLITIFEEIYLVLSDEILEEFREVMNREEVRVRFAYTQADITKFEEAIRAVAEVATIRSNYRVVDEDPDDDMVINTALDGHADYIVSGNRHLKKLRRFRGIRIVSPKAFMTIIAKRFADLILSRSDFG